MNQTQNPAQNEPSEFAVGFTFGEITTSRAVDEIETEVAKPLVIEAGNAFEHAQHFGALALSSGSWRRALEARHGRQHRERQVRRPIRPKLGEIVGADHEWRHRQAGSERSRCSRPLRDGPVEGDDE